MDEEIKYQGCKILLRSCDLCDNDVTLCAKNDILQVRKIRRHSLRYKLIDSNAKITIHNYFYS